MQRSTSGIFLALTMVLLSACGADTPTPTAQRAPVAEPADPQTAQLYNRSCRSCHASGASGAPLTGDQAAWAPRVAQGLDLMLDHTISGFKGMPPMGMCMDCSEEQFQALIEYMAQTTLQ